jgi:hypothetical protein
LIKKGYRVHVLPRGWSVTLETLRSFQIIIRANGYMAYTEREVAAYKQVLEEGKVLILLSEYQRPPVGAFQWLSDTVAPGNRGQDYPDAVAEMIGVRFADTIKGRISKHTDHPLFDGLESLEYMTGSAVHSVTTPITPVAWVGSAPVVATSRFADSSILLMGDTNTIQVSAPFANNVVRWLGKQPCND